MVDWVIQFAQAAFYLLAAPLMVGLLRTVRSRLQRRQGPSPLQPYRDLLKFWVKEPVVPARASLLFAAAPVTVFACYLTLSFVLPVGYLPRTHALWPSDLLLLMYVLGLARFVLALAGMDAGAPFGGLGSSRDMFLNLVGEPSLIFLVFTLAIQHRTTNVLTIIRRSLDLLPLGRLYNPSLLLLAIALALILLAEAGRLPFDNPVTHLELTMIGKAIHLEYAGPQRALLEWADMLRLTFLVTLWFDLVVPGSLSTDPSLPALAGSAGMYLLKLAIAALLLAVWEAFQVRTRLRAVMVPALTGFLFALVAALFAVVLPPVT
jgi:formate hydrogenlyase subunit 4